MNGDELSLQMGGQFGDRQTAARGHAGDLIAIGLRGGCLIEVDQAWIGGRKLNALVTSPAAQPQMASKLLNGGASPTNCARKIAAPSC